MKVAVIGSINVDVIYHVDRMPVKGETLFGNSYEMKNGGKGANQGVILSALEDDVLFFGAVGKDVYGEQSLENFKNLGLNGNVLIKEGNSGLAIIQITNQDNSIVVFKGTNDLINTNDIDTFFDNNKDIEVIVSQLEINIEAVKYMIRKAHSLGIKVILNPAPALYLEEEVVSLVDYLIPNETEAELLFGTSDLEAIIEKGQGKVLITHGSKGVLYYDNGVKLAPAQDIDVVDTTGAGDSFVAGFTSGIMRNLPIKKAVERGIEVASITCMHLGAQTSYQKVKEWNK